MIIHDPKKAASLIIAGSMPKKEDSSGEPDASDSSGIAQDIMDAIKSGSVHELESALRAFHAECESGYGDDEPADDMGEE